MRAQQLCLAVFCILTIHFVLGVDKSGMQGFFAMSKSVVPIKFLKFAEESGMQGFMNFARMIKPKLAEESGMQAFFKSAMALDSISPFKLAEESGMQDFLKHSMGVDRINPLGFAEESGLKKFFEAAAFTVNKTKQVVKRRAIKEVTKYTPETSGIRGFFESAAAHAAPIVAVAVSVPLRRRLAEESGLKGLLIYAQSLIKRKPTPEIEMNTFSGKPVEQSGIREFLDLVSTRKVVAPVAVEKSGMQDFLKNSMGVGKTPFNFAEESGLKGFLVNAARKERKPTLTASRPVVQPNPESSGMKDFFEFAAANAYKIEKPVIELTPIAEQSGMRGFVESPRPSHTSKSSMGDFLNFIKERQHERLAETEEKKEGNGIISVIKSPFVCHLPVRRPKIQLAETEEKKDEAPKVTLDKNGNTVTNGMTIINNPYVCYFPAPKPILAPALHVIKRLLKKN